MERGGGCWVFIIWGLLPVCMWLTAAGVTAETAGVGPRVLPCFAGECVHNRLPMDSTQKKDTALLTQSLLTRAPRRVRRQTEVMDVDEERQKEGYKSHRLGCTQSEEQQTACLNGKCYALDMGHLRRPFCHCPAKWEGDRCEQLSAYYFITYYAQLKKGAIIGGVVVGLIIIIVVISVCCSIRKRKKRRKDNEKKETEDNKPETKKRRKDNEKKETEDNKPETYAMMPDEENQV